MPEGIWTNLVQDYAIYAASITTIVTGGIFLFKKVVNPVIKHFQQWYDACEKIDRIFLELSPNNGSSVKDKINSIDEGLTIVGERLRAYLTDTDMAHFETDAQGNFTQVNRTFTRLVERNPSELLGHGWYNSIQQKHRESVVKSWIEAINEQRELTINFNFETPSGTVIPVRGTSYKMTNQEGEVIGYLGKIKVVETPIN